MTLLLMEKYIYKISPENNDCRHIAGIFFPTAPALIVYFEVTRHITMQEPIIRSEQAPCARVTAFSRASLFLERFWREF